MYALQCWETGNYTLYTSLLNFEQILMLRNVFKYRLLPTFHVRVCACSNYLYLIPVATDW